MKALSDERKARIKKIESGLLEGNADQVKKDLEWLSAFDNLQSQRKTYKFKIYRFLVMGLICISIIALAFYFRVGTINFQGEFQVTKLKMVLAEDWQSGTAISCTMLDVDNLAKIECYDLNIQTASDDYSAYTINLAGDKIFVQNLTLTKSAKVAFKTRGGNLDLSIQHDSIVADIDCSPRSKIQISGSQTMAYEADDVNGPRVTVWSRKALEVPIQWYIKGVEPWSITDLHPSDILFEDEYEENDVVKARSSLMTGKIRILETNVDHVLSENDLIQFSDLKIRRLKIVFNKENIDVRIEGTSAIQAGPEGFVDNLNPTYAEYLYNEKRVALFYTCALFIWGFLSNVLTLFQRK